MSARKLKAGWPAPRLALRDPIALRALVLILVTASFFAATGERMKRVEAAFDWQGVVTPANFRIDAWVTPPVYTGRPPVMLPGLRPGETARGRSRRWRCRPAACWWCARPATCAFDVARKGALGRRQVRSERAAPKGIEQRRFVIKGDGSATVQGVGDGLAWRFTALPDRPPTIALDQGSRAAGARLAQARL